MKRTVWLWELFGFAFVSLGGTLLHFLYDLLGGAVWIAAFSGVNESTWEHMKLLFWPMLIYLIFEYFFFKGYPAFVSVKLRGMLLGLALIPTVFYLYNGIIGKSPDWINISIFFISAAAVFIYETKALNSGKDFSPSPKAAAVCIACIAVLFAVFSFLPPELAIFMEPAG